MYSGIENTADRIDHTNPELYILTAWRVVQMPNVFSIIRGEEVNIFSWLFYPFNSIGVGFSSGVSYRKAQVLLWQLSTPISKIGSGLEFLF